MRRSEMMGGGGGRFGSLHQQSLMGSTQGYGRSQNSGMMADDKRIVLMSRQTSGATGGSPNLSGSSTFSSPSSHSYGDLRHQLSMKSNRVNDSSRYSSRSSGNGTSSSFVKYERSLSPPAKMSRTAGGSSAVSDAAASKAKFKCQVCRLQFNTIHDFDDHMGSAGHAANMNAVSAAYIDKSMHMKSSTTPPAAGPKRQAPVPFHGRLERGRMSAAPPKRPGVCTVCDRSYVGTSEYHVQSKQHQHKQYLVKKGCVLCHINGFANYTAYVRHIDSATHKQRKKELSGGANAAARPSPKPERSDISSVKTPPNKSESVSVKVKSEPEDVEESNPSAHGPMSSQLDEASVASDIALTASDDDLLDDIVYNADTAIGVEEVISVTGYFCKLCHKFYNNEAMARITHCKSKQHFDKYMAAVRRKRQSRYVVVDEVSTTQHDATAP